MVSTLALSMKPLATVSVKPLATLVAHQPPIVLMHGKIARAANPRVGLGEGTGLGVCRARGTVGGRARVGLWGVGVANKKCC